MSAFWAVARTRVHKEQFAVERLKERGFEVLNLEFRSGDRISRIFPGYVFVKVIDQWRAIDRTHGIIGLIKFGDCPARCPDSEIHRIKLRMDSHGLVHLPRKPRRIRGDKVMITGGPFAGRLAIYAGMTAKERETVLLTLLGREVRVTVPSKFVEALPG